MADKSPISIPPSIPPTMPEASAVAVSGPAATPAKSSLLKGDALLLAVSVVWGMAFVFQRSGMEHIGPVSFVAYRYLLGGLVLIPFWFWFERSSFKLRVAGDRHCYALALIMTAAALFQQYGLVHTTAGRAGFITTLYVVFVPVVGLWFGYKTHKYTWLGGGLALIGLWLLAGPRADQFLSGDALVFVSAIMWAGQVFYIGRVSARLPVFRLAFFQIFGCGLLSLPLALTTETVTLDIIQRAAPALIYVALLSTTLGFTVQIFAQRHTCPSHAAIIMGMEGVFAALGGWWLLGEGLSWIELCGCLLMFGAGLTSQARLFFPSAETGASKAQNNADITSEETSVSKIDKTDAEWREQLNDEQYAVLREAATEYPGSSPLNHEHRPGKYLCAGCGAVLFESATKFDAGCGWPSFNQVVPGSVETEADYKLRMPRTEFHCANCGGHMGHVFDDGPQPTGLRYCTNGVALEFVPDDK